MDAMPPSRQPALAWDWRAAALAAVCAVPAAVVVLDDVSRGVALAVGVLPAAIIGLAPRRRRRLAVVALGVLTGVPMFLGGALAGVPVLAVAAIAALGVATVLLAERSRLGMIAMTLSLPMVGVGLSYDDIGEAAGVAALIVAGSVFACLVALPWPERPAPPPPAGPRPATPTLDYGLRLGAAGATAAAIGFLLDLDHPGWACAAALLVMRPASELQRIRSVGRIAAVTAGAVAAIALVQLTPPAGVYAAAVIAALAAAAGTRPSRWYITAGFTTFLVFVLLLYGEPENAASRFVERVGETLLGVALAFVFGFALTRRGSR
jgi:Fusaric acid resistance protein family